jgi:transposase
MTATIGIDVSKGTLAVVRLAADGKVKHKSCANTAAGHALLVTWLARHDAAPLPVGLEATGGYHEDVAVALHAAGHHVSVLNPSAVAAYAQSQLSRTKTDPGDAWLIARYVQTHEPPAWIPAPAERRALQALVRRLEAVQEMRIQELNRSERVTTAAVRTSIDATLAHLDAQIALLRQAIRQHFDDHPTLRADRDLLTSIPGIGDTTAALVLSELLDPKRFTSARHVAAFSGLVPRLRYSGTSLHQRGHLSKVGSARLRHGLYWAAVTAIRCNPRFQHFAARLRGAGKVPLVIIAAVMRKLLELAYTLLRTRAPFDPTRVTI